ncbi:hypothetical protein Ddc_19063 [Ditylenchus destructor]|nr:hypothetical protein Ddc_19063 [Ditylenchus destructor]
MRGGPLSSPSTCIAKSAPVEASSALSRHSSTVVSPGPPSSVGIPRREQPQRMRALPDVAQHLARQRVVGLEAELALQRQQLLLDEAQRTGAQVVVDGSEGLPDFLASDLAVGVLHVLLAVDDVEEALFIAAREVAGQQPAVAHRLGAERGLAPVAGEDVLAADDDLADLADRDLAALFVDDEHLGLSIGPAAGREPMRRARQCLGVIAGGQRGHGGGGFAQSVALGQHGADAAPGFLDAGRRHRRGAVAELAQAGEIGLIEEGLFQQRVDHGGDHEGVGDAVLTDRLEEGLRLEAVEEVERRAGVEEGLHQHAARMRDRADQRDAVAGPGRALVAEQHLADACAAIAEGLHRGLDLAGRAGREMQDGEVILRHGDVDRSVGGDGHQGLDVKVAVGRAGEADEVTDRGEAGRVRAAMGEAGAGEEDQRLGAFGDVAGLVLGEAGVERDLHQTGLEERGFQHHQRGRVARLHGDSVALGQAQSDQRGGEPIAADVELAKADAVVAAHDGRPLAPEARAVPDVPADVPRGHGLSPFF